MMQGGGATSLLLPLHRGQRLLVEMVVQDRLDALVGVGLSGQGTGAGCLYALGAMLLRQTQHPQAGTKRLLRMRARSEDLLDEPSGGRSARPNPESVQGSTRCSIDEREACARAQWCSGTCGRSADDWRRALPDGRTRRLQRSGARR